MDRGRYERYVATRQTILVHTRDEFAVQMLDDLAEGLLLARDPHEAGAARDRVPEALELLVERGELTRRAANRLWARFRGCGPAIDWPPSWDRSGASSAWVVRDH